MTDEYIRKQDAVKASLEFIVEYLGGAFDEELQKGLKNNLESLEPADVALVVHSRWIKTADGAECEKCGREAVYQIIDNHWQYEPFCPHCGAIMDGHREE